MLAVDWVPPPELILLLLAGLIALIKKLVDAARAFRKRVREHQEEMERRGGVELSEAPRTEPRPASRQAPRPAPAPPPVPGPVVLEPPPRRLPPRLPLARKERPPSPRRLEPLPPKEATARPSAVRRHVVELLSSGRESLRDAVILREVLGPPKALRRAHWIR